MSKKFAIALALVLSVMFVFAACAPAATPAPAATEAPAAATAAPAAATEAPAAPAADKIVIGFSQCTLDSPFYVALMDSAKAKAAELGVEFIYLDAQNDIKKQNDDISDLISKGVDAVILNPVDADGVAPSLKALEEKKIPIITVDRSVNAKVASFVGRDNKAMGKLMGERAIAILGGAGKAQGTILEVMGAAGNNVTDARSGGFHEAVDAEKGIKVIQSPNCDYIRSKAIEAVMDIIQANKDIKVVYAHNDDMALGALQVFEQNKIAVKVVGVDGLMEAVQAIKDGKYEATTINDPGILGAIAVDTAVKVVKGETVPEYIDGGTGVIDAANADKYLDNTKVFAEIK